MAKGKFRGGRFQKARDRAKKAQEELDEEMRIIASENAGVVTKDSTATARVRGDSLVVPKRTSATLRRGQVVGGAKTASDSLLQTEYELGRVKSKLFGFGGVAGARKRPGLSSLVSKHDSLRAEARRLSKKQRRK